MNILIDGAGSIGIALGASMVSENVTVSFFARGKTAEEIKEKGIKRVGIFKHITCSSDEYTVYTDYENIPKNNFDYVFICSKTIANNEISSKLNDNKSIFKNNGKIIIFQNGYGNDEPYLKYFSKDQVYCARVITGFMRPERNISEITVHTAPLLLGSLQGANVESLKPVAKLINNSGIPSETTENLSEYLWAKMLYNCTLNPLGAILDVNYGKLTENEYSMDIMNKLIEEIFNVMNAAGLKTLWSSAEEYKQEFYSKLVPDTYDHVSSTAQDIQKKKKTEIDTLTGKVISIGERYDVDVTVNKTIYNLIKSIEAKF
jgi:2-dehydropantoate 2-reductase